MDMNNFIIQKTAQIQCALDVINKNGRGIVYILEKHKLVAVLTDGDVRRGILKDIDINENIMVIANIAPIYIEDNNTNDVFQMMNEKKITSIPIVSKDGIMKSIIFNDGTHYFPVSDLDLPVVIMAGGKGTRLYPYTKILPKPLIPIGDKTITELIIDHFTNYGCNNYKMIVNYKKEFIKSYISSCVHKTSVDFVEEEEFLGTGGGLKLLKDKINGTFFMTNCDVIIEENYAEIFDYHRKNNCIITIVCADKKVEIPYGTVSTNEQGYVKELKEKPTFSILTNTGMYLIEPAFLDEIEDNKFIHITEVIDRCIIKKLNVGVFKIRADAWLDMGQFDELERMRTRDYLGKGIED